MVRQERSIIVFFLQKLSEICCVYVCIYVFIHSFLIDLFLKRMFN